MKSSATKAKLGVLHMYEAAEQLRVIMIAAIACCHLLLPEQLVDQLLQRCQLARIYEIKSLHTKWA